MASPAANCLSKSSPSKCTASGSRCKERHRSAAIWRTVSLAGSIAKVCRNSSRASPALPFCSNFSPRSTRLAISCRSARFGVSAIGKVVHSAGRQKLGIPSIPSVRSSPVQNSRQAQGVQQRGNAVTRLRRSYLSAVLAPQITQVRVRRRIRLPLFGCSANVRKGRGCTNEAPARDRAYASRNISEFPA